MGLKFGGKTLELVFVKKFIFGATLKESFSQFQKF